MRRLVWFLSWLLVFSPPLLNAQHNEVDVYIGGVLDTEYHDVSVFRSGSFLIESGGRVNTVAILGALYGTREHLAGGLNAGPRFRLENGEFGVKGGFIFEERQDNKQLIGGPTLGLTAESFFGLTAEWLFGWRFLLRQPPNNEPVIPDGFGPMLAVSLKWNLKKFLGSRKK